ncbi:MAG: hypothetical protein ACFFEO_15230, partial [Candidatus Thorarchaeota archaeon]
MTLNVIVDKVLNDISTTVKETADDCEIYRYFCDSVEYDFEATLKENNLGEIPYIPWSLFKLSNYKFKELLRGNSFENLDYWMESSSTCGDPSIVGRLSPDIEVLKANYSRVFNTFSYKDQVDNLILFAPNIRFINKIRHTFYGKDAYLLYKSIVDIWEGKHINYLLQFFLGRTISHILTKRKIQAVIGINGKKLKSELKRVEQEKIPSIMANSPLWMHRVLDDFYRENKRT